MMGLISPSARYLRRALQKKFDFYLVLDFEATCDERINVDPMSQEIIEFPCLKVDSESLKITGRFQQFVKPLHRPELSSFCTRLTGITQEMVDESAAFPEVLEQFNAWLRSEKLSPTGGGGDVSRGESGAASWVFVTCGDWDVGAMLPRQCHLSTVPLPAYAQRWVNVKSVFASTEKAWPGSLISMMNSLALKHTGKLHSGLDDCENIAKVLNHLYLERGADISACVNHSHFCQ